MIRRAPLLSAGMLLAALGPVHAQSPILPLGEWGHSSNHGLDCSPPFLRIEPNRVIKRLGGGEGRCPITKIRKSGKSLIVDAKCVYDKSILEEHLIEADDDDDSFSLVIKSSALILFNNTPHGLCRAVGDGK